MGIKIKNLQTGEFEKFNIPALKGEKGEPGEIEPSEKVDYIGKQHSKLRDTMNANVDYIIKTAIGEFNYLDYEGQHITATNSIEGHAKSAILKGQTLVNILNGSVSINENVPYHDYKTDIEFKANTVYTAIFKVESEATSITCGLLEDGGTWNGGLTDVRSGYNKVLLTPSTTKTYGLRIRHFDGASVAINTSDVMLIEGDYTNQEIPYFTGIQSVKMPVLTTTGKNLFDGHLQLAWDTVYAPVNFLQVQENKNYVISEANSQLKGATMYCFDENKNKVATLDGTSKTIPNGVKYIKWYVSINNGVDISDIKIQIEQGTQATPYEPYKSNTLSTPEEVVLRSLPNGVCDTLNLNTGEYVQRIGEITLNGSETNWSVTNQAGWESTPNTIAFGQSFTPRAKAYNAGEMSSVICDKFATITANGTWGAGGLDEAGVSINQNSRFDIRIERTKLSDEGLTAFKQWLSQNPITVQYEFETPIVKTVDLSDYHVYSYKGTTHYDCSSEEGSLVPTLSVKVPTDTQLTIQEQKATTQTLLIKNMDLQQSIKEVQAMNLAFNTALYNSFNSIRAEVEDIKKHVSTNENLEGSF